MAAIFSWYLLRNYRMVTFLGRPHLRNFAVKVPDGGIVLVLTNQRTIRGNRSGT